jgi:hypothetical protein
VLLLITGSRDGTSDEICRRLGNKVFRFNYDIYKDYSLELSPHCWRIANPSGHAISSENVTSCFWWKAFNFPLENEDNYIISEVKYTFREIYSWCRLKNIVKGNPPDFHNQIGKINLLKIASAFFPIPDSLVTFKCAGLPNLASSSIVAKSLATAQTDSKAVLLTTEVIPEQLNPSFPWFLQKKIQSDWDVTVFVCNDSLYAYAKSRKNLKGLDWRGEQSLDPSQKDWIKFELTPIQMKAINNFCREISVKWGRLDFMKVEDDLFFLEFNANGQWLFLDYDGSDGILVNVLKYLTGT